MNNLEAMAARADGQQFKQFQAASDAVVEEQKRLPYAIVERKDGILYAAGPLGDSQPVTPAYPGATVGDIVSIRGDVANG
jgi:hypothetical protein